MAIRIVFFDWGGVLSGSSTDRFLRKARMKRTRRVSRVFQEACAGEIPAYEALRQLSGSKAARLFEASLSAGAVRPRRPVWAIARRLRKAGIRTGILSNNTIEWSWNILTRTPADREFEPAIFSALDSLRTARRLVKPETAIFRHAVRRAGVRASEAAFIDDREANVRAARTCGLHATRFSGARELAGWLRSLDLPG